MRDRARRHVQSGSRGVIFGTPSILVATPNYRAAALLAVRLYHRQETVQLGPGGRALSQPRGLGSSPAVGCEPRVLRRARCWVSVALTCYSPAGKTRCELGAEPRDGESRAGVRPGGGGARSNRLDRAGSGGGSRPPRPWGSGPKSPPSAAGGVPASVSSPRGGPAAADPSLCCGPRGGTRRPFPLLLGVPRVLTRVWAVGRGVESRRPVPARGHWRS